MWDVSSSSTTSLKPPRARHAVERRRRMSSSRGRRAWPSDRAIGAAPWHAPPRRARPRAGATRRVAGGFGPTTAGPQQAQRRAGRRLTSTEPSHGDKATGSPRRRSSGPATARRQLREIPDRSTPPEPADARRPQAGIRAASRHRDACVRGRSPTSRPARRAVATPASSRRFRPARARRSDPDDPGYIPTSGGAARSTRSAAHAATARGAGYGSRADARDDWGQFVRKANCQP